MQVVGKQDWDLRKLRMPQPKNGERGAKPQVYRSQGSVIWESTVRKDCSLFTVRDLYPAAIYTCSEEIVGERKLSAVCTYDLQIPDLSMEPISLYDRYYGIIIPVDQMVALILSYLGLGKAR